MDDTTLPNSYPNSYQEAVAAATKFAPSVVGRWVNSPTGIALIRRVDDDHIDMIVDALTQADGADNVVIGRTPSGELVSIGVVPAGAAFCLCDGRVNIAVPNFRVGGYLSRFKVVDLAETAESPVEFLYREIDKWCMAVSAEPQSREDGESICANAAAEFSARTASGEQVTIKVNVTSG